MEEVFCNIYIRYSMIFTEPVIPEQMERKSTAKTWSGIVTYKTNLL